MKNFITPQELANIQKDVVILDVRDDKAYATGHIEGAFAINLAGDLSGPVEEHGGRHPLPNMVEFAKKWNVLVLLKILLLLFVTAGFS